MQSSTSALVTDNGECTTEIQDRMENCKVVVMAMKHIWQSFYKNECKGSFVKDTSATSDNVWLRKRETGEKTTCLYDTI